jgi:hypothetical protein
MPEPPPATDPRRAEGLAGRTRVVFSNDIALRAENLRQPRRLEQLQIE